jgi:hypothetical protein
MLGLWVSQSYGQQQGRVTINPDVTSSPEEFISSADVLARVELLRDELDLIRQEMGNPPPVRLEISVRSAAPRETYFHAYTLSDKAHRLAFEFTGRPERPLGILLSADTTPVNVYAVVSEALESIYEAKDALAIKESPKENRYDPSTNSSQVLDAIIQANRELNNILYQQYSPLDVYEQISLSINFATRLLEQFAGSTPVLAAPRIQRRKKPADVFHQLVQLFDDIHDVARASGESTLDLKVRSTAPNSITPSDVYDIAKMVLAELAYFYSLLKDPPPVDEPQYPRNRVLPSHVYQQVGVLKAQLAQLKTFAAKHPNWLKSE